MYSSFYKNYIYMYMYTYIMHQYMYIRCISGDVRHRHVTLLPPPDFAHSWPNSARRRWRLEILSPAWLDEAARPTSNWIQLILYTSHEVKVCLNAGVWYTCLLCVFRSGLMPGLKSSSAILSDTPSWSRSAVTTNSTTMLTGLHPHSFIFSYNVHDCT